MYRVREYVSPESIEECARLYKGNKRSRLIGGNLFLRMISIEIPLAIDLSRCGMDYITEDADGTIRIGAMSSLRSLEISPILQGYESGIVSRSVGEIIGVQFRNLATAGASVASKYGFSDVITPLLACGARVRLFEQGELPLEDFLQQPRTRDILTEIILPKADGRGSFCNFRNSAGDFSILNVAAVRRGSTWRLAVGARPQCAALAAHAMEQLALGASPAFAAQTAADELTFDSNMRASAEYRKTLCTVLCTRALQEISEVNR